MEIIFVRHSETTPIILEQIIGLKGQYWDYTHEQHLEWMHNNLNGGDYHILIQDDMKKLVAYLNLVVLEISLSDGSHERAFGIGNVCVEKVRERKGLGLLLMHVTNYFLKQEGVQGLLLCKESLVSFYAKAGWTVFEGTFLVAGEKIPATLMSLHPSKNEVLLIDKNF